MAQTLDVAHTNLNLFPVLAALLRTHSVTDAAAELGVGQSAVSHALRELRSLLDDPLFVRTARGMRPTLRALELEPHVSLALESLSAGMRSTPTFQASTSTRRFSLATTDEVATDLLPALVAMLFQEAPSCHLAIESTNTELDLERLRKGRLDMVLALQPRSSAGLELEFLYRDDFVCVVRAGHPKIGKRMTLKRYLQLPHVLVAPGTGPGMVDEVLKKQGLSRNVLVSTRYFLSAPEIVAGSDCVLTLPKRFASAMAKRLPLQVLKVPIEVPPFSVYSITAKTRGADPALRWFRAAVLRAVL